MGTFYRYLPDLSIAQVMFTTGLTAAVLGTLGLSGAFGAEGIAWRHGQLAGSGGGWPLRVAAALTAAGLAAAGTAVALAGTGRLDPHGMIVIPALHDAASDQPVRYTQACSHTAIPVCVNPAYAIFLPSVTAAIGPELSELAGLPGAPARISQVAEVYQQEPQNGINVLGDVAGDSAFILPDQVPGQPGVTSGQFVGQLEGTLGLRLMREVILGTDGPAAAQGPSQAELAVMAGSVRSGGALIVPAGVQGPDRGQLPVPGGPAVLAARRFAKLTPVARHAWLARHLAALRAGRISLTQLP